MTDRIRFSKRALAALRAPVRGRVRVFDTVSPYLCLRLTPSGAKSFYYRRKRDGAVIEIHLGPMHALTIEEARKQADGLSGDIAKGERPTARRQQVTTVAELHDAYLADYLEASGKPTADARSIFNVHLRRWHSRKITSITPDEVKHLQRGIVRSGRSPRVANAAMENLRAMVNWALKHNRYRGPNPCVGVEKLPGENERDRFLEPDELLRFLRALEAGEPNFRDLILMLLLTGARRGNVQSMKWEEISFTRAIWTIPTEQTKAKKAYRVPLSAEALAILETRRTRANGCEWVFPGRSSTGHIVDVRRGWAKVCKAAGLTDVRPHDLRRTFASYQLMAGASLPIIGKSLGHASLQSTQVYARLNLDPVRESIEKATAVMLEAAGTRS